MSPTPGVGTAGIRLGPNQRGTSASSAIRQRPELRLGGVGGMARQTRHAAYPRRALPSDDTGEDRALPPDAQEPHPAGKLLFARRARGSDRSLRRPLQSPALPREHRQSDAGRRLLRARSNPAGKRKGTLSRSDTERVEQALAGDFELARRYALVLEELAETINLNETLGEPSASVAETLFAATGVW